MPTGSGLLYFLQMGCQCSQVPGTRPRRSGAPHLENASRPSLDMPTGSGLPYILQMGCQCSQVPMTRPRRSGTPPPENASRPSLDMPTLSGLPYILQTGLVVSRYMRQPTEHTSQVGLRGLAQSQLEPGYFASWQTSLLPEATNSKYVQGQRAAICAAGTHQLRESSS